MGSTEVLTGIRLQLAGIGQFADIDILEKLLAGFAVAAFLLLGRRYWKSPFAMPAQLLASILIFYLALFLLGVSVGERADPRLDVCRAGAGKVCPALDARISPLPVVGIAGTRR